CLRAMWKGASLLLTPGQASNSGHSTRVRVTEADRSLTRSTAANMSPLLQGWDRYSSAQCRRPGPKRQVSQTVLQCFSLLCPATEQLADEARKVSLSLVVQ